MSLAVKRTRESAAPAPFPSASLPYRFSVEQYHRMAEAGILTENDRAELLEGVITYKMTHNPPHDCTISLLQAELQARLPAEWLLRIQSSVTLADSEPEPDLAVARGPARRYQRAHPGPRDLPLVIEVADTTLLQDRNDKGRAYARARIPVYWVVNLNAHSIEVYTEPRAGRSPVYRQRRDYHEDQAVPVVLHGPEIGQIPVRDVLPGV
jgi:Uma2 family endonuclease